jgi:serine protease
MLCFGIEDMRPIGGDRMNIRLLTGPILTLLVCMLPPALSSAAPSPPRWQAREEATREEIEYIPGEILVKFAAGVSDRSMREFMITAGTEVISTHRMGVRRLRIPPDRSEREVIDLLKEDPRIEYAELNTICHAFTTPNDPGYSYQWHFPAINAPSAWEVSAGSGVTVAILDTGIAYEDWPVPPHETATVREGISQYYRAPDLAGTTFVPGYDFVNDDEHPNDNSSHGTHVAGTVAQTTNNSLGTAGLAFECSLMPVKVLDYSGSGSASDLADGICWAADNGAQVINMSLGWFPGYDPGATVHDAVEYAYNQGVVLVASSGNWGTGTVAFPAAYPEVIAVGATRFDDEITEYSQYGPEQELVAPGGDVTLDQNGDGERDGVLQQTFAGHSFGPPEILSDPTEFDYYFYDGTSMAAPHVTALVALMIANGQTGVESIRTILHETAVDLGDPGWDEVYGYGLIDAYGALTYDPGGCADVRTDKEAGGGEASGILRVARSRPNPFRSSTRMEIRLSEAAHVTVVVLSARGRKVKTLLSRSMSPGTHSVLWDGTNHRGEPVPAGIYLVQVQAGADKATLKTILTK